MAKAKQAPSVDSTADLYEWAADVLRLRFDEVMSYDGAVRVPWNVNAVHDMRVALRRLRGALRDFVQVINEKPLRRVKSDLKRISDTLGVVRDLDVAIIALQELAKIAKSDEIKLGIGELIDEHKVLRKRARARLQKALESINLEALRQRFSLRIEESLRQQELFGPGNLAEAGRSIVESRLAEFCSLGPAIYAPFEGVRLHELRLAAKRLRYSIELFAVCWADEIMPFATELSVLQTHLGDVHDCDVWIDTFTKLLRKDSKARNPNRSAAAVWLLSRFVAQRSKAYRSALDLWSEWEADKFVDRLKQLIRE